MRRTTWPWPDRAATCRAVRPSKSTADSTWPRKVAYSSKAEEGAEAEAEVEAEEEGEVEEALVPDGEGAAATEPAAAAASGSA
jgi:hypothetical protein